MVVSSLVQVLLVVDDTSSAQLQVGSLADPESLIRKTDLPYRPAYSACVSYRLSCLKKRFFFFLFRHFSIAYISASRPLFLAAISSF